MLVIEGCMPERPMERSIRPEPSNFTKAPRSLRKGGSPMKAKAVVVLLLSGIAAAGWCRATSPFAISAQPLVSVPIGPTLGDGTPFYTIGGGASLRAEYTLPAAQ